MRRACPGALTLRIMPRISSHLICLPLPAVPLKGLLPAACSIDSRKQLRAWGTGDEGA